MEFTDNPISLPDLTTWNGGLLDNDETLPSDDPFLSVSPEDFTQFSLIVDIILMTVVCVIGLLGNSTGLYVLSRDTDYKKGSIYSYLLCLMAVDSAYLCLGLILAACYIINIIDEELGVIIEKNTVQYRPFLDIHLSVVSTVILIFMSLERLLAILVPFKVKTMFISQHPYKLCFASFMIATAIAGPFAISFNVITIQTPNNKTQYMPNIKDGFEDYVNIFSFIHAVFLHYIAPLVIIVINAIILSTFIQYTKERSSKLGPSSSQMNQRKITIVIVVVAGLYVLLSIPNIFIQTLMFVNEDYNYVGKYRLVFLMFVHAGDLMARINAATDFYVYILVCNHYRELAKNVICCCVYDDFNLESMSSSTKSFKRTGSVKTAQEN